MVALVDPEQCRFACSATIDVQFTDSNPEGDLLPDGQAPYLNEAIQIVPEPVTTGVPTVLRATVVNPNPFRILVDGTSAYAQPGIGLTFDPIGEVREHQVPASGGRCWRSTGCPPCPRSTASNSSTPHVVHREESDGWGRPGTEKPLGAACPVDTASGQGHHSESRCSRRRDDPANGSLRPRDPIRSTGSSSMSRYVIPAQNVSAHQPIFNTPQYPLRHFLPTACQYLTISQTEDTE